MSAHFPPIVSAAPMAVGKRRCDNRSSLTAKRVRRMQLGNYLLAETK